MSLATAPPGGAGDSPWMDAPSPAHPLRGDHSVEVAIVGGGYLGLSAALRLRRAGCDVMVLERDRCGGGASGRNAGHLTATIGKDVYTCLRQWGPRRGLALARLAQDAVGTTEALIRDLQIACDYLPVGNVVAGLHPSHRLLLERAAASVGQAGLPMTFLDEADMAARGLPKAFRFGIHERDGGHLHPGKYLRGLRDAAVAAGVRLHEGVEVLEVRPGHPACVKTAGGDVAAKQVLVATNGFVRPDLAGVAARLLPIRVSLFRTQPLTSDQLLHIGWTGREGIYTAHEVLESYRLTADNRIVGGSKWVAYGDGGPQVPRPSQAERERFAGLVAMRFPEARGIVLDDCWSGWIAGTIDHLPILSPRSPKGNVGFALGCNGHGVALATFLGTAMADRILGQERPDLAILERWTLPLPSEGLRRLAFKAVLAPLEARDRRVDRQASFADSSA